MKRVSIGFSDQTHETMKLYAELRGCSFSTAVSEIVDGVEPEIRKVIKVLVEAQNAPKEMQEKAAEYLLKMNRLAAEAKSEMEGQINLIEGEK